MEGANICCCCCDFRFHINKFLLRKNRIKSQCLKVKETLKTFPSEACVHPTRTHTNAHTHALTHSCALLHRRTVAISPPLASSPLCDCYWKCRAATGASSWRIYMTQVHVLESPYVHTQTRTHVRARTHTNTCLHTLQEAREQSSPQRLDLMSAT